MSRKKCSVEVPLGFKWCPSCDKVRDHEEFYRSKQRKDGFAPYCKTCVKVKGSDYFNKVKSEPKIDVFIKKCFTCGETKDSSKFYKDIGNKDGINSNCIDCLTIKKNKDKVIVIIPEGYKVCGHCKETKLKNEFGKCKQTKSGYYSYCKICTKTSHEKSRRSLLSREKIKLDCKTCSKCKEDKSSDNFSKNCNSPDGLSSWCKPCDKENRKKSYELMKLKKKIYKETKKCITCKEIKTRDNFNIANTSSDGLGKYCKSCIEIQNKERWKKFTSDIEGYIPKELTPEKINERIKGRPLSLLNYAGKSSGKSEWKCLVCGDTWKATPTHIISSGRGCPNCSGNKRHTVEYINQKIENRNVTLVKFGGNKKTPSLWKCGECNETFLNTSSHVINRDQGCPNCFSNSKGEDKLKLILENHNIINMSPKLKMHKIARKTNKVIVDFYFQYNGDKYIIEYHGKQHYEFCPRFHKTIEDFERQQNRDKVLIEYCSLNDIQYIEFNDSFSVGQMTEILTNYLKE